MENPMLIKVEVNLDHYIDNYHESIKEIIKHELTKAVQNAIKKDPRFSKMVRERVDEYFK